MRRCRQARAEEQRPRLLTLAENTPDLAAEAFAKADNMTDLSQALTLLAHRFPELRRPRRRSRPLKAALPKTPLVLDKWFTIQATIPEQTLLPV